MSSDNPLKAADEWLALEPRWSPHIDGSTVAIRKLAYTGDAAMKDAHADRTDLEYAA